MENTQKDTFPAQHQNRQPGKESKMNPAPRFDDINYKAAGNDSSYITGQVFHVNGGTIIN